MNKNHDNTIFDMLVNEIYERYINNCYFYLPQLCSMLVYKDSYSLEQFLTEHCTDRLKFAVKIYWLIMSFKKSNIQLENKAVKIEIAMVNNKVKKMKNTNNTHLNNNGETGDCAPLSMIYQKSLSKEIRLNYFIKLCSFYDQLTIICDNLHKIEREDRKEHLDAYVKKLNQNISKLKKNINKELSNDINSYFHYGYLLPFENSDSSTYDEDSNIIVNVLPEYCKIFNSKARVPVMLTFETLKVKELKKWDELIENDPNGVTYNNQAETNGSDNNSNNQEQDIKNKIIEYDSLDDFLNKNEVEKNRKNSSPLKEKEKGIIKNNDEQIKRMSTMENFKNNDDEQLNYNEIKKIDYSSVVENNLSKCNLDNIENKNDNEIKNNDKPRKLSEGKQIEISTYNCKSSLYGLVDWKSVDPKFNPFGKPWLLTMDKIKENSRFRNFQSYQIRSYIYKSNDDLKQELMVLQLIKRCQEIFNQANLPLKLGVYEILITSEKSGMIEVLPDTASIDQIKKMVPEYFSMKDFYLKIFGMNYEEAQINFAQSLAAYSVICYLFQIKDRHNGNILIDNCGHIIHIDFGFVLGINPGNINFESVPFKLTQDFIDILGGFNSEIYEYYILLMMKALLELRKHVDNFVSIIEIMKNGCEMPCFVPGYFEQRINELKLRFTSNDNKNDYHLYARNLVHESANSWRTNKYDYFQKVTQNIYY
jgi:phosphatidylinositol 4-kinase